MSSRPRCCFFFQAEDGIRGGHVTGVQTCALPISTLPERERYSGNSRAGDIGSKDSGRTPFPKEPEHPAEVRPPLRLRARSEERRVGKERGQLGGLRQ